MLRPGLFMSPGGGRFSPALLFAGGTKGFWYDPSDLSTLFQNSAGTIPVTDVEQPVGKMADKSGRGNHATQTTDASRPVLRRTAGGLYYLDFDGTDDFFVTGAVDLSSTAQVATVAGVEKSSDVAGVISEGGTTINTGSGKFSLRTDANPDFSFISRGSISAQPTSVATYTIPATVVMTGLGDIANDLATLRINGAQVSQITTDQGTGSFHGSNVYYIGRRAGTSVAFNGRLYGMLAINRSFVGAELAQTEAWMNMKTGAY